jgi:hypothetical protein
MVGLGPRFDHVGQLVVTARVGFEEAVERRIDVVLGTVFQQAVDGFGQLGFPVFVFELAAGVGKADGQTLQLAASRERRSREPKRVRFISVPEIQRCDFNSRWSDPPVCVEFLEIDRFPIRLDRMATVPLVPRGRLGPCSKWRETGNDRESPESCAAGRAGRGVEWGALG